MVQVELKSGYNDGSGLKLAGDIVFVEEKTAAFMLKEGLASLCGNVFPDSSPKDQEETPVHQDDFNEYVPDDQKDEEQEDTKTDEAQDEVSEAQNKGKKRG